MFDRARLGQYIRKRKRTLIHSYLNLLQKLFYQTVRIKQVNLFSKNVLLGKIALIYLYNDAYVGRGIVFGTCSRLPVRLRKFRAAETKMTSTTLY